MLNGFWSSRYLEGNFLNRSACTTSPPLPCFSFPRLLSNAVSSCSQWFVSSGGSSCSFCTVISLIVIIRASYLQPWHPLPRETIWAKTEGVGWVGVWWWRNIQTHTKFFDFHVQWCGKYGHMCFTVSHGRSASLCLIISLTCRGLGSTDGNAFCLSGLHDLCMQKQYSLHICKRISLSGNIALFYRKSNVNSDRDSEDGSRQ